MIPMAMDSKNDGEAVLDRNTMIYALVGNLSIQWTIF